MSQLRKQPSNQNLPNGYGQATPALGFPFLTTSEIHDCLSALGIGANHEDIQKPTATFAQFIYASCLDVLLAMPPDVMDSPRVALLGMMEYKELYSDTLQFMIFFKHCKDLANLCGVTKFTMSDLTRPEAQRFRLQMSGIMNFAKFREEDGHQMFRSELQGEMQKQTELTERLNRKLERINQDIQTTRDKIEVDKPEAEHARVKNETLRKELLELRENQQALSRQVEDKKRDRQAVMEQASSKAHELTTLTQQSNAARSRLVQSPERIKRHITEMSSNLGNEKSTLASYQRKYRELSHRVDIIANLEHEVKGLIELEKSIDDQRGKVDEARRSLETLRKKLDDKGIESNGFDARLGQLERQMQNANDKLKRQQEMGKDLHEKADARREYLKEQYVTKSKERGVLQKERDILANEQKELNGEMAAYIQSNEADINALLAEYWTMRKQAEDYMTTVELKLGLDKYM